MQSKYRLLVVRLGAMGDILHALPAITALRQAHPNWQIDWVVDPRWQALLAVPGTTERGKQMPVVDQLHFAPTRDWRKGPLSRRTITSVNSLRVQLKSAGYDAVLDVQGAMRSAVLARMAGCSRVIGEAMPRETAARLLFTEQVITH
ncbi:MAG TPA: glycosyltransferase family 9 protein, partial [Candidatus Angelobacter sp.]|nr:glycosyltransferase family 9 protein [Candidatus Angelobacter sp.]